VLSVSIRRGAHRRTALSGYHRRGGRVHQQAPTRWEDTTAELWCESQLLDPADDERVYLELHLQCLRLRGNAFSWCVTLDTARRLRDQLTEHLGAVQ
jgi:hypothetical protein